MEPAARAFSIGSRGRSRPSVAVAWCVAMVTPARAELRAGTAKADVTPPLGGHMYGYGDRGDNVSSGVHDRLYAKALVLAAGSGTEAREIAIVTLDLGAFEKDRVRRVKEAVRAATGIEHLFLVASHTHSSPVLELEFPTAAGALSPRRRAQDRRRGGRGARPRCARLVSRWAGARSKRDTTAARCCPTAASACAGRTASASRPSPSTTRSASSRSTAPTASRSRRWPTSPATRWCSGRRTWRSRPTIRAR